LLNLLSVDCETVNPGGFPGERLFKIKLSAGGDYTDAAPERYFSGMKITVSGSKIEKTDTYAIAVPSGEVVIVSADIVYAVK
jgi:hypothetical protein